MNAKKNEQLNERKANERRNSTQPNKRTVKSADRRLHATDRFPSPKKQNCRVNGREMNRQTNPKQTQARPQPNQNKETTEGTEIICTIKLLLKPE